MKLCKSTNRKLTVENLEFTQRTFLILKKKHLTIRNHERFRQSG